MGFWSSLCCGFDGGAIFILVQAPHGGKMATNNPESPCFFLQTQGRRALEVPLEEWKIFPQASRNLSSVSHWPEVGCMSIPEAGILAENTVELLSRTLTPCPPLARSGGGSWLLKPVVCSWEMCILHEKFQKVAKRRGNEC